eukprot:UN22581
MSTISIRELLNQKEIVDSVNNLVDYDITIVKEFLESPYPTWAPSLTEFAEAGIKLEV